MLVLSFLPIVLNEMKILSEYKRNKIGWYTRNVLSAEAIQFVKYLMEKEATKFILEIGSGSGIDAEYFSNSGFNVASTDIIRSNRTINLICDCRNIPFRDNSVANIYVRGVLHLLGTIDSKPMNDLITILAPSGILFMTYYLTISDGKQNNVLASEFNGDDRVIILSENKRTKTHWGHSHIIYKICLQKKKESL